MPESRTAPKRKGKTKSFPQNQPSNRNQEPIYRQPTWEAQDMFSINGETLEMFATFLEPYRAMIRMVDAVIASGEIENKIHVKYYYGDGAPVPDTDPRLNPLMEKEENRLAEWRKIISEKQEKLQQWAMASQEKLESDVENSIENSVLNEVADSIEETDNTIPFTPSITESN